MIDPRQPVRHVAGESPCVVEFGPDFVDPFRRGLETGVVFGVQKGSDALHHLGEPAEGLLRPIEAGTHHHRRDGREEHQRCHDRDQGTAGGNERRLRDDSGRAHDGSTDPRADGHQRRGIGGRQEDAAGHQGRRSRAPGAEHREQPGAVDGAAGLGGLVRGPGCSQGFAGVATEVDHGERASVVGQDLADGVVGGIDLKVEALHGVLQLVGEGRSRETKRPSALPRPRSANSGTRRNLGRVRDGSKTEAPWAAPSMVAGAGY